MFIEKRNSDNMKVKLGRGEYTFKDIDTRKVHKVRASDATHAVANLNKKLGKEVNYSFLGYKK
ncbi:MAG: hypothetical protein ACOC5T_09510 [Elusimicrobiota bacterium]